MIEPGSVECYRVPSRWSLTLISRDTAPYAGIMNRLQLRYDTTGDALTLRPFVDGQDLLSAYTNDQGRDPDVLLPPLSARLLPSRAGHTVIVGVCSCGESGCGSLSVRIRRVHSEVVWEPTDASRYETLKRAYRFDLTEYLDAVDEAGEGPPVGEGQGRRVARAVALMLGRYDQQHESMTFFHNAKLDWISVWPWTSNVIKVCMSRGDEQITYEFSARLDESESQLAVRVASEITRLRLDRS